MLQLWAKCPLWKHLSQEWVHFCKVSLLISSLILKILYSGIKLFLSTPSKNTYLVESISKTVVAAFCFADFLWGADSPIQKKLFYFKRFRKLLGTVALLGVFQTILQYMRVRRNHTLYLSRLKLVQQYLPIDILSARPLFWSAKELPVGVDD